MKIIGFGHKKRVGKDEATRFAISFARQYRPDLHTHVLSFGNVIKDYAYHMYCWGGLERAVYYDNHPDQIEEVLPAIGKSPRQIWDTLGKICRDEICDKTWVELALRDVPDNADLLICKDVRGWSEFNLIKEIGIAVKMQRDAAPAGGPVDRILDNASWDLNLDNNADLRTLNTNVQRLISQKTDEWFPLT